MDRKKVDSEQHRRPLFDGLNQHKKKEKVSFHVPGHKNGMNWDETGSSLQSALSFDQTEVTGLDYLHDPEGILNESQELLSKFYGSKKSYYLINGSTVGNLAMIMGATNKGDQVFVDRGCHQSVIHALELAELQPIFLTPDWTETEQAPLGVNIKNLKEAFEQYPSVKALIATYPTYDGMVYPIKELIEYARKRDCLVLVDEAHGPHLTLGNPFPTSALDLGADVVVQSAHKMLPSLTQTAYLHIGSHTSDALKDKIEHYLHMLQSSSPSYPLMVSLEYARHFLANFTKKDLIATLKYRDLWKKHFEKAGLTIFQSDDPLKIKVSLIHQSGEELANQLEEQGVFGEKTDATTVLLTFPLLKKEIKTTEPFSIHIKQSLKNEVPKRMKTPLLIPPFAELDLSYEKQTRSTTKRISLAEAEGKIAARNITPYPPGIPLVLKGEKIKVEQIKQINHYLDQNMRVTGLENQKEVVFFSEND